jgi:hypothetical protein
MTSGKGVTMPMSEAEAILRHRALVLAGASRIEIRDAALHVVTLAQLIAMEANARRPCSS